MNNKSEIFIGFKRGIGFILACFLVAAIITLLFLFYIYLSTNYEFRFK